VSYLNLPGPIVARRPLVWLNILCLDASIVAVSWQWLFARVFGVSVPLAESEALFLTAWVIYLVDRLIDSISLPADVPKAAREEFCLRHKNIWVGLISIAVLLDAEVIFRGIGREAFIVGVFLGAIAVAYLVINHRLSRLWRAIPLKEVIVGFLFASGTLIALAPPLSPARSTIILAAFLFGSLCTLNCVSIAVWERDLDRAQGKYSIATRWPGMKLYVRVASFTLAAACGVLVLFDWRLWPLSVCLGVSGIFLATLHFVSIARDERTALADLVLLTPLALMLAGKIW
jgi:hypothetical protein